jgi:uncharacterized membrane protein YbhN (UPF0104 family)
MISQSLQSNRIWSHLALGIGGSLLILGGMYFAASNAGHNISPAQLIDVIKSSSFSLFLAYVVASILGLVFRAWRYHVLLKASGEAKIPGTKDMILITAVRNMTVDLLPARLGELVFVGLLRKQAGTHVSSGLSALLFATLLDVLILAPITIAIGLMVGFPTKQPFLLALIALFVVIGFMMGIKYILPIFDKWFVRWAAHPNRVLSSVFGFIVSITEAVESTMRAGVLMKVISLTFAVRIFKYAGLLFLFFGLTQSSFPDLSELSSVKVLGAMIASEMTASLPIPTLMSFGSWELGGMTVLAFYGAVPHAALLTLLGVHIQTQAVDYGIGIAAFLALLLLAKTRNTQAVSERRRNMIAIVFALFAILAAWMAINAVPERRLDSAQSLTQVSRPESLPVPAWLKKIDGFIVWSSNRSGIHNIWLMNLPEMSIRPLTDSPHTENFARISPDGTRVVFARSHKEWQSLRDEKPWDIWMLDIASGEEQLIAKWGLSPEWSPDGTSIVFKRDPGMIISVNVFTLKEQIYYESGKDEFLSSRVNLSTPSIGEDDRLAFTYRNRGQPTNIIRDAGGEFTVVHRDSCQVKWAPSGDFVTYVQKGGKQTNQIMRYDPATKKKTRLLDLPGEFSHEYFPRLSHDERFMVFAASNDGHEHDLADYEIFLWPLGTDALEAARLTFDANNDSWPDIWLTK